MNPPNSAVSPFEFDDNQPKYLQLQASLVPGGSAAGSALESQADGLLPGSIVRLELHSDPVVLDEQPADARGSVRFSSQIPEGIESGVHRLILSGITPNGEEVSSTAAFEIDDSGIVTAFVAATESLSGPPSESDAERALEVGRPTYDPDSNIATSAALALSTAVLLTVVSSGSSTGKPASSSAPATDSTEQPQSSPGAGSGDSRDTSSQGSLDSISAKSIVNVDAEAESWGDRSSTWRLAGGSRLHSRLTQAHTWVSGRSTVLARILTDGQSVRAIFGALHVVPIAMGALIGVFAGFSVDGIVSPAFAVVAAIIVSSMFDALVGLTGWLGFAVVVIARFGIDGWFDVRTLLGLAVLFFGLPLIANSLRPLRRVPGGPLTRVDRLADVVLGPLLSAIAASGAYLALNGLSGLQLVSQGEADRIRWVAGSAVIMRMALEEIAVRAYPRRMREVELRSSRSTPLVIDIATIGMKCGIFLLVASSYFGFGWGTWMVVVTMSVVPSLSLVSDRFPNSELVRHWFPRGVIRSVIMLFVGVWFSSLILGVDIETERAKSLAAALMIPGVAVGIIDLFGRVGGEWPDRLAKRLVGGCLWVFLLAVMFGRIAI